MGSQTEYSYDVFISYSHADRAWVQNKLLPLLEASGLSVCIDYRDFAIGAPSVTEMERGVQMSRKTLLVLTPNYLKSAWVKFEALMLQTLDPASQELRLIPLLKTKCNLPLHLRYLTYIDFTVGNLDAAWQQLLGSLNAPQTLSRFPSSPPVFERRLYFDHLIETHTRLFAGREDCIETILTFLKTNPCGYIFVESLSGYGKTSLLAKLVQENPHFAYHFISQAYKTHGSDFDPTEMDSLLINLCEQLQAETSDITTQLSPRARFHSLLRSSPENGSRVIVVDAVDEINRHPNYLLGIFPERLPPGVFIILSARKLGDRDYLSEIGLKSATIDKAIDLPGLDRPAIAHLLRLAGGKAPPVAASEEFVGKLYQISNGDPFYLRFLIEDIAYGAITHNNIDRVPTGLIEYLDTQLSILDRGAHLPQQRDILGIILEAYSPVSRADLIGMVAGLNGINFQMVIKDIQRFLLVYEDMYTFCHNRFKEYFQSRA